MNCKQYGYGITHTHINIILKNLKTKLMQFQGALIKEQNITFAVVVVKSYVLDSIHASDNARHSFMPAFPGLPIILMAQDHDGTPIYQGRKDIASYLAQLHISQIPWTTYNIN